MLEQQRPKPYLDRVFAESAPSLLMTTGWLALATTFLASRGQYHSTFHKNMANVAYLPETMIILGSLGLMKSRNNEPLKMVSRRAALFGMVATAVCFAAVGATDEQFKNFMNSPRGREDVVELATMLGKDFKRHMRTGIDILLNLTYKVDKAPEIL